MDLKGRIIVYSIVGCPHCMKAKHSLKEKGIPFHDVSLNSFPQCRADLRERTKKTSVPQIFFNNIHVGGNDDLQKLVSNARSIIHIGLFAFFPGSQVHLHACTLPLIVVIL